MQSWINKNYKTIIISAFLIPIITVALVSISHVTKWYGISNPVMWSVYLSTGIEIAALSALAAISADMGRKVYFPFGIVTLVQFIGNIYFAYSFIDVNNPSFKSWVELTSPLVEFMGVDPNDFIGHKRFLAFFAGGMLPIISLSFLHMLVKFTQNYKNETNTPIEPNTPVVDAKDIVGEVSRVRLSEDDLSVLEEILSTPPKPNEEFETPKEVAEQIINEPQPINEPVMEFVPALGDDEVREMVLDEWERKFDLVEEEPIVEEKPIIEEPTVVETPIIEEEILTVEEPTVVETPIIEEPIVEVEVPIIEEETPIVEEATVEEPIAEQPIIETSIEDEKKN